LCSAFSERYPALVTITTSCTCGEQGVSSDSYSRREKANLALDVLLVDQLSHDLAKE
jgi:hypothetical protein